MIIPSARCIRLAGLLTLGSLVGTLWPMGGWLFALGLIALAVATLVEGRQLQRDSIQIRRRIPPRLSLNEPEEIVDVLDNLCTFPLQVRLTQGTVVDVVIEPMISPVRDLLPRGRCELTFQVTCLSRGELKLPRPVVRFGRPNGLAERQTALDVDSTLHVFPNLAQLKRYEILKQSRALSALGIHRAHATGMGTEFDHLRNYGQDDDYRRIHWKATARRGEPIVQIVRAERGQSVVIAVDVSHWMGISAGGLSRLDYAIDAALMLTHVAGKSGDRVGLLLFSNEVVHFIQPSSKPGQIRRIINSLYNTFPQPVHPSYRNLSRYILARRVRRSLVVVLSEPTDETSASELTFALATLKQRHLPLSVGFKDPALHELTNHIPVDHTDLCRRLAAREAIEEREQRLADQRIKGLHTLDVLPEDLSISLVNRYLDLKERGAL